MLEKTPYSFGHSGTCVNGQLLVFGGFANDSTATHCLLLNDFTRKFSNFVHFILWSSGVVGMACIPSRQVSSSNLADGTSFRKLLLENDDIFGITSCIFGSE